MTGFHHQEGAAAHDALNRMRRAFERGTGCNLTANMIQSLSVTSIGQIWSEADPRHAAALIAQAEKGEQE